MNLEESTVRTRATIMTACCLALLSLSARRGIGQDAEVIGTPSPYQQASPASMPYNATGDLGTGCESSCTPPTTPWYYWWSTWHWFDRYHDRGQHYAYQPPLPGWYYFRPYSVSQLRAQQEAAMQWGGDPRNPYAVGNLPAPETAPRPATVTPLSSRQTSPNVSYEIAASYAEPSVQQAAPAADIVPWPVILRNPRFAADRARIEEPYRRSLRGQGAPTAADYQDMIDAAAQMKATLWQMTVDVSDQDSLSAEKFLEQLAAEARDQLRASLAPADAGSASVYSGGTMSGY